MGAATYKAYQSVGGGKLELVDRPVEEPTAGMVRVARRRPCPCRRGAGSKELHRCFL
jgi:hypothetical protein